jgi:ParB-like chromosome segregation protein Spo0J
VPISITRAPSFRGPKRATTAVTQGVVVSALPVAALVPYAENARTHSPAQVAQIAASIAEFGFVNPVLVGDDGVLVAGHGRVMAARKLGLNDAPVIVLSHLTPTQRRALMIADNQIATNAGWNE